MLQIPGSAPDHRPCPPEARPSSATVRTGPGRIVDHRRKRIAEWSPPGSVRILLPKSDPRTGSGPILSAGHVRGPATTRSDGPGGTSCLAVPVTPRGIPSILIAGKGSLATAETGVNRRGQFFRRTEVAFQDDPYQNRPGVWPGCSPLNSWQACCHPPHRWGAGHPSRIRGKPSTPPRMIAVGHPTGESDAREQVGLIWPRRAPSTPPQGCPLRSRFYTLDGSLRTQTGPARRPSSQGGPKA